MSKRSNEAFPNPSAAVTQAWTGLLRSRDLVLGAIERDLKAADLPPLAWYDVLWELKRAEEGRLRPFEIEERTLLAQYNLSRLIDRLEREGLVRREPFAGDGRGCTVAITQGGSALQEKIWAVYAAAITRHVAAKLDEEEAALLASLLGKLAGV